MIKLPSRALVHTEMVAAVTLRVSDKMPARQLRCLDADETPKDAKQFQDTVREAPNCSEFLSRN